MWFEWEYEEIGCGGPKGYGLRITLPTNIPVWIVVDGGGYT